MSEHDLQHVIDGVVSATLKSKKAWDIAKIGSVVISSCIILISFGAWKEDWKGWRNEVTVWKDKTETKVNEHDRFISIMQGERNQQMRDRNDAAGSKLTQNK